MTISEQTYSMLSSDIAVGMEVKPEDIQELLEFFSKNTYKAKDTHPKVQSIMKKCLGLFSLDYNYSVLPNNGGELSTNYPSSMVILESEKLSEEPGLSSVTSLSTASTPSNKTSTPLCQVHEGIELAGSSQCSCSTNGVPKTSASMQAFKTQNTCDDEPTLGVTNGKTVTSMVDSLSTNGIEKDLDINNILIETSDYQIDGEGKASSFHGESNNGGGGEETQESPIRLGSTSFTSSLSSDLSCSGPQENGLEVTKLKDLCSRARFARCRARFPIPVILYKQKHICRSATLSGGPEIYGRSSFDYFFSGGVDWKQYCEEGEDEFFVPETQSDWQLFDRVRSQDIRLLKAFQVQTIVDLMVEKKKVKFGVNVTSSEKVDKENRYSDFNIVSLPYPGCEFFKKYRDNGYNGEDLVFEWNQTHVDANILVPPDPVTASLSTDWTSYRKWDLIVLTQNYLKLLLAYLRQSEDGLLIHCISGWDRTPLFVSLLRLSLWADGAIHKSLSAEQILYLTLAYDWLLFGHNLEDRLSKGEEILFFCFYFLKYIVSGDYSVDGSPEMPKSQQHTRSRNDSDVHLDGVLLEGGSLASPEGSSWSLSSCNSSSSSKSIDNPPVYFNVESESWDDSMGANHMKNGRRKENTQGLDTTFAQNHDETDCSPSLHKNGNLDLGSLIHDQTSSNNHPQCSSFTRPNSTQQHSSSASSSTTCGLSVQNGNKPDSLQCQGKTSPVAVPRSNRSSHHRHESSSSASIGSWQFITGTGSLRETISSSDPGSSHSHPSRLSLSSAIECIEASESSCTLVEELTPVEFPDKHPLSSFDSNYEMPVNGSRKGFESELDESLVLRDGQSSIAVSETTAKATPPSSGMFCRSTNFMSRRRERLQTVRAHFYTLYAAAIGFQFKNVNDNGSGGLGSLIGNFATKVGIRSAHRHMS